MDVNVPTFLYLPPGGTQLTRHYVSTDAGVNNPPIPDGAVRVVCISDTHNEHDSIVLPWGHVLVCTN